MAKVLGMTVLPEWAQVEGPDAVLDNIQRRAGVTAIATSPYVMEQVADGTGSREPPADAGAGSVRLLDRHLWGRREIFCRTAPSYAPDRAHYRGLRYQPAEPDALTAREGATVTRFIEAAKSRGLGVYLQVQAAIPPGYRVQFGAPKGDDVPLLPDGREPGQRLDANGSLASPHIRAYLKALLADLAAAYLAIDGFRIDWPEYPPYTLDSVFLDFSDHALGFARRAGYDIARMRNDAARAYRHLHGSLINADLDRPAASWMALYPGLGDLFRLKADIVTDFLADIRSALPHGKTLVPQCFPPPWNLVSGFDFARAAPYCDGIGIKHYTMHWPMMLRFYADALKTANPGLDGTRLARMLVRLLGTGGPEPGGIADLRYPEPDEDHPVGTEALATTISTARTAAGSVPVFGFAHGYGPIEDVARRMQAAWSASPDGMWVNRYGYMSDDKLDRLGTIVRRTGSAAA